ncbi:thioredoxin 1 [bacterium A37T11]|nr:thioredoxin 1 [bacterium A37T11]
MTRILKFEKNDCAPCNQVSDFLDKKGVNYEKVNPFDKPELAMRYRVRTVPTVIVLQENEETQRIIGFKPEELAALPLV